MFDRFNPFSDICLKLPKHRYCFKRRQGDIITTKNEGQEYDKSNPGLTALQPPGGVIKSKWMSEMLS
jgi:hypothetical protein